MASKEELLAEAYKRGILPADKKAAYEEAIRRGIVDKSPSLLQSVGSHIQKNWQNMMGDVQNVIAGSASQETKKKLGITATPEQVTQSGERLTTGIAGTLGPGVAGKLPKPSTPMSAVRDQTLKEIKKAGYAIPPSESGGSMTARIGEMASGKYKTQELASYINRNVTNNLAKKALGIPKNVELSQASINSIRQEAGKAYQKMADLGQLRVPSNLTTNNLWPKIHTTIGKGALQQKIVQAKDVVETLKQLRHDGNAYLQAYGRNADPETLSKAKNLLDTAGKLDKFLENSAKSLGKSSLAKEFQNARVTIAKTYTIENAMNPATGDVNATQLARLLKKSKPLSGEIKTIAKMGATFPKAVREVSGFMPNPLTTVDIGYGGGLAALGHLPVAAGLAAARVGGRYASLYPETTGAITRNLLQYLQPIGASAQYQGLLSP